MNIKILTGLVALIVTIAACKKNEFRRDEYTTPTGKAFVKIAYFSMDSVRKAIQLYINNELVSNSIGGGTPFPGGGFNTLGDSFNGYLAVDADKSSVEIKGVTTIPGSTIINKVIFTVTAPVTKDIQQVIFITDTAAKTTAYTVKSETSRPDSGYVKMQFTNALSNAGPIKFYYRDSLVASDVKFKDVTDFVTLRLYPSATTLATYAKDSVPGVNKALATYNFTSISNQKIYTVFGRGYQYATDAERMPKLSLIIAK